MHLVSYVLVQSRRLFADLDEMEDEEDRYARAELKKKMNTQKGGKRSSTDAGKHKKGKKSTKGPREVGARAGRHHGGRSSTDGGSKSKKVHPR